MKSFIKVFAVTLMLAVVAVSCGKVEKILPKKDGKWKTTSTSTAIYMNSVLDTTVVTLSNDSSDVMEFLKDGVGNVISTDTTTSFTWSVNDNNDEITICQTFLSVQLCVTSTILESSKNEMTWFYTDKVTGDTNWSESTSINTRVE